ncbi:hypothetical protein ACFCYN_20190 [Gottfriedia sp. NPDC056225]|uniref:hypothetical protein n=1 Tax=Gottfriedia sp. NPDC056225 TaxID=3345751 RepID=UPI0035DFDA18
MRIIVVEYIKELSDGYIVKFNSPYGSAEGRWVGSKPKLNAEFDIEIDIPEILEWEKQINQIDKDITQITRDENHVILSGVLESVEPDGYSVLRMGDNIVIFELTGGNYQNYPIGSYVKIKTKQILLYGFGYELN